MPRLPHLIGSYDLSLFYNPHEDTSTPSAPSPDINQDLITSWPTLGPADDAGASTGTGGNGTSKRRSSSPKSFLRRRVDLFPPDGVNHTTTRRSTHPATTAQSAESADISTSLPADASPISQLPPIPCSFIPDVAEQPEKMYTDSKGESSKSGSLKKTHLDGHGASTSLDSQPVSVNLPSHILSTGKQTTVQPLPSPSAAAIDGDTLPDHPSLERLSIAERGQTQAQGAGEEEVESIMGLEKGALGVVKEPGCDTTEDEYPPESSSRPAIAARSKASDTRTINLAGDHNTRPETIITSSADVDPMAASPPCTAVTEKPDGKSSDLTPAQPKLSPNQKKRQKKKTAGARKKAGMERNETGFWWRYGSSSGSSETDTLLSRRAIPKGHVFLWDHPVTFLQPGFDVNAANAMYDSIADKPEHKARVDGLRRSEGREREDDSVYGKLMDNSLALQYPAGWRVVLEHIPFLKVSCDPNANYVWDAQRRRGQLVALKNIPDNTPLTIRTQEGLKSSHHRQKKFTEMRITCHCAFCHRTTEQHKHSDRNRFNIALLNRAMHTGLSSPSSSSSSSLPALLKNIEQTLLLMSTEGFVELYHDAFKYGLAVCAACEDEESAREWAKGVRDTACLGQSQVVGGWEEAGRMVEDPKRHEQWGQRGGWEEGWGPSREVILKTIGEFDFDEWEKEMKEKPLGEYAYLPDFEDEKAE
ncbi:hypothetical protein B9479_004271 [Cryptococcus floricola]|uniref:SET domain-containing protein n=1 Tax=Cryptococcus floricola TaxID=2591691 RepID=A0A5D3AWC9_9TREE|nr:hypothetical protein B9479_004271 [Cryptococcus floricola]